jgi:hypothetical protein
MNRLVILTIVLVCGMLMGSAAAQQDVYDNGPTDGNTDAWTINFGFAVSDSFTLNNSVNIFGLAFATWMFEGDVLQSADLFITSQEFGGTTFFSGTVNFTQSGCVANGFGFNVCTENGSFSGPNLNAGTYWLNLQNAVVSNGDPVYWDENGGPSSASDSSVGSIPSESFSLDPGGCGAGRVSPDCGPPPPTTPEPGSLLLLGAGIVVSALTGMKLLR